MAAFQTAQLTVDVTFDPDITDVEALGSALDNVIQAGLPAVGPLSEYGDPIFSESYVAGEPPRMSYVDAHQALSEKVRRGMGRTPQRGLAVPDRFATISDEKAFEVAKAVQLGVKGLLGDVLSQQLPDHVRVEGSKVFYRQAGELFAMRELVNVISTMLWAGVSPDDPRRSLQVPFTSGLMANVLMTWDFLQGSDFLDDFLEENVSADGTPVTGEEAQHKLAAFVPELTRTLLRKLQAATHQPEGDELSMTAPRILVLIDLLVKCLLYFTQAPTDPAAAAQAPEVVQLRMSIMAMIYGYMSRQQSEESGLVLEGNDALEFLRELLAAASR